LPRFFPPEHLNVEKTGETLAPLACWKANTNCPSKSRRRSLRHRTNYGFFLDPSILNLWSSPADACIRGGHQPSTAIVASEKPQPDPAFLKIFLNST
jgi:hypothetical protein